MKKIILTGLAFTAFSIQGKAQEISKNALGIRFGAGSSNGTEISYQRKLSQKNRLEGDLGLYSHDHYNAFKLTGLYQWVWNIDKGFNWYAGAGAGVGSYSYKNGYSNGDGDTSGMTLNASGDVGIEYNFKFPLQVALDYRPEFYLINGGNNNFGSNLGLALRYRF